MFSVQEFSKKIKEQYPQYKDVDDFELASKIVQQYPVYASKVDLKKKDAPPIPPVKLPQESAPVSAVSPSTPIAPSPSESKLPSPTEQKPVVPAVAEVKPVPAPVKQDPITEEVTAWLNKPGGGASIYDAKTPKDQAVQYYSTLRTEDPAKYYSLTNFRDAFAGLFNAQKKYYYENPDEARADYQSTYTEEMGGKADYDFARAMDIVKTGKRDGVALTQEQISEAQKDLDNRIQQLAIRNHNRLLGLMPTEADQGDVREQKRSYSGLNQALGEFRTQVDRFVPQDQRKEVYKTIYKSVRPLFTRSLQETVFNERGIDKLKQQIPGYNDLNDYQIMYLETLRNTDPEVFENKLKQLTVPRNLVAEKAESGDLTPARSSYDFKRGWETLNKEAEDEGLKMEEDYVAGEIARLQSISKKNNGLTEDQMKVYQGYQKRLQNIDNTRMTQYDRYFNAVNAEMLDRIGKATGVGTQNRVYRGMTAIGGMMSDAYNFVADLMWSSDDPTISDITKMGAQDNYESLVNRKAEELTEGGVSYAVDPEYKKLLDEVGQRYGGWTGRSVVSAEDAAKLRNAWIEYKKKYGDDPIAVVKNQNAGDINLSANSVLNAVEDVASQILGTIILSGATGGTASASKVKQLANLFGTTFATTVNDYEAQALREGKSNATQIAIRNATIDAATELIGNDLARVKKLFGGKGTAGKILDGISDAEWKRIANAPKRGIFTKFKDAGGQVFTKAVAPAGTETFEELSAEGLKNLFDGKEFTHDMKNVGVTTFIGTLATFGAGLPFSYKNVNYGTRAAMYEAGTNPDWYRESVNKQLRDGSITTKEAQQRIDVIDRMAKIVGSISPVNKDGKPLSDKQRVNMAYNQYVKEIASSQKNVAGKNQRLNEVVEELDADNDRILNGEAVEETPTPTTEQPGVGEAEVVPAGQAAELGAEAPGGVVESPTAKEEMPVEQKPSQAPAPVTEEVTAPSPAVKVSDVIGRRGTYKGKKGRFYVDGQLVVFDVDDSNLEYEVGNVEKIGETAVGDLGIEAEGKVVGINEAGNITVRGKEFINNYSDPTQAISRDEEGNVVSVTLESPDGKKRTFRKDVAQDIAAEIEKNKPIKPAREEVPVEVAEGAPPVQPAVAPITEVPPAPQPKTIEEQAAEDQVETERLIGGQAAKNRKAGRYVKDNVEYVRNEPGQGTYSDKKGEVRFTEEPGAKGVVVPFRYKLVEAETLQPSHINGLRNPNFFIPEAQPKSRLDKASIQAEEGFADNPRFKELGENTNAYSGAPVVNQRNEVIQGNNRTAGLKKGYRRGNNKYREDLRANATQFGFSPSQVDQMKNPVLVREVAVSDDGAIELGNYDAKDLETGSKRGLDPIAITRRLPFETKQRLAELFFNDEMTVNEAIKENIKRIMENLGKYLNQAQRNTMINNEGKLTENGTRDLESVAKQLLFDEGDVTLPQQYEYLTYTQRKGIEISLPHIFGAGEKNIKNNVQNAIAALNGYRSSGAANFGQWLSQTDAFQDTPKDRYSPLDLKIAEMLATAKTQKEIKEKFQQFEDAVKAKEATMFEPAQEGASKEEAIKKIFEVEAKPQTQEKKTKLTKKEVAQPEPETEKTKKDGKEKPRKVETISEGVRGEVEGKKEGEVPTEARAGDPIRKFSEIVRSGKISKLGGFKTGTGFDAVWDASLEVIAKALDGGASLADAIEAGLKYVKKTGWYKKLTNKEDFDNKYREHLNQEYNAVQERSAEEVLQPEPKKTGKSRGGRRRMEQSKQRIEAAEKKNEAKGKEEKITKLSLAGIQDVGSQFGLEVPMSQPKTDEQLKEDAENKISEWEQKGQYQENIEKLLGMIGTQQGVLTDTQRMILENHLSNQKEALMKLDPTSAEFDSKLREIKRLLNLASIARSEAGRALRLPSTGVVHPIADLPTALVTKMDALGVDELTDIQKEEVFEQVENYKEAETKADEKIRVMEEKAAEMELKDMAAEEKKKPKKTKEQRQEDRKKALQAAREALRDLRTGKSGLSAVPLPGIRELIAIAPHVKTVVSSYLGEGVDNLSTIIDRVHEEFSDVLPGISKRNIRQIIAGEFNTKVPESELRKKARQLQVEAKLLEEYEKLLLGEPTTEKQKRQKNLKTKEIRDKIKALRNEKELGETTGENKIPDELKKIRAITSRNKKMVEEIDQKIANKDFAKKDKTTIIGNPDLRRRFPKEYNEMLDAIKAREDAKAEFDIAVVRDEMSKEGGWKKFVRGGKNLIATLKAIRAGIDDSAVLVQNYVAIMAHPSAGIKAFITHLDHGISQKRFDRYLTELHENKPVWELITQSGLDITEPTSLLQEKREEAFSNNLLDKTFKIGGKSYNIGKWTTRPFERMYTSMGNAMRLNVFLKISEKWHDQGITFETDPGRYQALAMMLNTETGRGKLHKNIQAASEIVTPIIWSPRLMQSKFNILGLSDLAGAAGMGKGYYSQLYKLSPEVAKYARNDAAKFIGAGAGLIAITLLSGAGDADLDPESSGFGTITLGNLRISVFDGFNKYVRLISQGIMGTTKVPVGYAEGEEKDKEKVEINRLKSVLKFFRGSATPAGGLVINYLDGEDYLGRPVTVRGEMLNMIEPMSVSGMREAVKKDGALGAVVGFFKFFGAQINDNRDFPARAKMEIKDPETLKKRPVSRAEYEQFVKVKDEFYSEYLEDLKAGQAIIYLDQEGKIRVFKDLDATERVNPDELDMWQELYYEKLTPEQLEDVLKKVESWSKDAAKKELFDE